MLVQKQKWEMHSSTGLSKQMANKDLRAEHRRILLKKLKHWLCLGILLHSRICRDTAAQVSCWKQDTTHSVKHYTHKLTASCRTVLFSFYSIHLSQKAPIYIHWATVGSCFKALPCPSNLLRSQELADLNRGLSHYSSAQLAGCSQTCHFIYSLPRLHTTAGSDLPA